MANPDNCPHCGYRLTWCRVCHRYVCERARQFHIDRDAGRPYWTCENPDWCSHGEGYEKKPRFAITADMGNWQIKDDETGQSMSYEGLGRKDWTLLDILNQLAFELDVLKRQLVKDTE